MEEVGRIFEKGGRNFFDGMKAPFTPEKFPAFKFSFDCILGYSITSAFYMRKREENLSENWNFAIFFLLPHGGVYECLVALVDEVAELALEHCAGDAGDSVVGLWLE